MPSTLSTLISIARANQFPSRSPTSPSSQRKLYFPPGGHTHDRHIIPPDRLHISLSDPVLVAAEERLSRLDPNWTKPSIKESTQLRSAASHLSTPQRFGDDPLDLAALDPVTMTSSPGHLSRARFHGDAAQDPGLLDSSDDSCDIVEVMSISFLDASPTDAHSVISRYGRDPAPLASETFKEELYIRGYLKRPASRPADTVPRKPRTTFVSMAHKVFPKVLGRRHRRKLSESRRAEQDSDAPFGCNADLSESDHLSTVVSVTLQAPHSENLESPGMDTTTTTTASESFDLHEFSYLTAFTTPPSSPSIVVLDAETFKKGV